MVQRTRGGNDVRVYAVVKDGRELSSAEVAQFEAEVTEAKKKEVNNYLRTLTITPCCIQEFKQRAKVRPVPWRWLHTWKHNADGSWSIKSRLVLKGFAEFLGSEVETYSPTADRSSHRRVAALASEHAIIRKRTDPVTRFSGRIWSQGAC